MDVKTNPVRSRAGVSEREVIASSSLSSSTSNAKALSEEQRSKLSNGFVFSDGTTSGVVTVTASADTMKELPVGSFTYDIQQKVSEVVTTILRGSFTVNEDISR
jgi:Ca2+-binding EF-hand superfamily protein